MGLPLVGTPLCKGAATAGIGHQVMLLGINIVCWDSIGWIGRGSNTEV